MGGYGHRNMYYATGLPGWVRFGYSPGWGGLPPAAQYLQNTGQTGAFLASLVTRLQLPGRGRCQEWHPNQRSRNLRRSMPRRRHLNDKWRR